MLKPQELTKYQERQIQKNKLKQIADSLLELNYESMNPLVEQPEVVEEQVEQVKEVEKEEMKVVEGMVQVFLKNTSNVEFDSILEMEDVEALVTGGRLLKAKLKYRKYSKYELKAGRITRCQIRKSQDAYHSIMHTYEGAELSLFFDRGLAHKYFHEELTCLLEKSKKTLK